MSALKVKRQYHSLLSTNEAELIADPEFSIYHHLRKPVTTWLIRPDYELFHAICKQVHGVTAASFLRAMVVDVLVEEGPQVKTVFGSLGNRTLELQK